MFNRLQTVAPAIGIALALCFVSGGQAEVPLSRSPERTRTLAMPMSDRMAQAGTLQCTYAGSSYQVGSYSCQAGKRMACRPIAGSLAGWVDTGDKC